MKIGIAGLGHLGQIHLRCLSNTSFEIVGCFDIDTKLSQDTAEQYNIRAFLSYEEMLENVDAVDIVSSSSSHFDLASKGLAANKHLFIEKPFVETIEQADLICAQARDADLKVQVGHVERYNPAVKSIAEMDMDPKFIEAHRLAMFNPRGTDVSVVMDLMIHDIDLVCNYIKSPIQSVDANGVSVVSHTPDICSARIVFENGSVANLTASRISMKNMRKFRIFEGSQYISLDLLEKNAQVIQIQDKEEGNQMEIQTSKGKKFVSIAVHDTQEGNAIEEELTDFYNSIVDDAEVAVNLNDALRSMKLATMILESIEKNNKKVLHG